MKKSELKEAIKAEITSILSEDINEIGFRPNTGLAQIKAQGEVDGADAITKELRQYNLKNVPDMDAYADGFVKGAASKAMFYKDKLDQAIRGGGDEESLMGLVGLKEEDENVNPNLPGLEKKIVEFVRKRASEHEIPVYNAFLSIEAKMAEMKDFFGEGKYSLEENEDEDDKAASKSAKKEKLGKQASKLSQEDEDRYERIKNGLEKLKKKGDEESIKRMKAILAKKDVQKLIKAKGRKESSFM